MHAKRAQLSAAANPLATVSNRWLRRAAQERHVQLQTRMEQGESDNRLLKGDNDSLRSIIDGSRLGSRV